MKEKKRKRSFFISIILIGMYLLILAIVYLQMLIQNQSKEVERYLSEIGKIQAIHLSYVLDPTQDLEILRKWIEIPMFYEAGYMDIVNQEGEIVLQSHHANSNQNIKNIFSIKFKSEKTKENLKQNLKNGKSGMLQIAFYENKNKKIATYTPIGDTNLFLFSFITEETLSGRFQVLLRISILFLGIIIISILLLLVYIHQMKEKNKRQLAKLKYEEKKKEEEKRQKFEQDFLKGIQEEEFKVYIQGKVDSKTEEWIGGELLVRWKKEEEILSPDKFIPLLEQYKLISKLDYYMLKKAYFYLEKWQKEKKRKLDISVNQSLLTIKEECYLEKVREIQSAYPYLTNELEIELTESIFVEDHISLQKKIEKLHQMKIQISMDDFGTGYSSFHRIQDYEIDTIKIDKAFLKEEKKLEKGKIVLESMIQMCQKLGIKTVAEGIETEEQVEFLRKVGCDLFQGYYYSKPIPIEEFEQNLK